MKIRTTAMGVVLAALSLAFVAAPAIQAQTHPVPSRVTAQVDDTRTVQLKGNVHPMARPEFDQGAVADSQPITKMHLLLQRSAAQETVLRQLMDAQQTKGSASYHAWLTPAQFGHQFGPSDADVQAVTDWLTRQGFQVSKVAAGRTVIEFSGTVAQVRNAFHTEIHNFTVNGEQHFANVSDPVIPQALSPVVAGVVSLSNFRKQPFIHRVGKFRRDLTTGEVTPLFTFNDVNGTFYAVGPADFSTIYNIPAQCGGTACTGTGQSIAIVGRSNINLQDVRDFRSIFGLPAKDPTIVLNGPDPGLVSGDEGESDLDVEWAGAVAPAAQIILVSTLSTQTDGVDGIDDSALYIVDNNVAPVLSDSYGSCESSMGATGNAYYNALWQQAAAEGITVVVAAGDNGAAGCDDPSSQTKTIGGIAVSGLASTPYNIAMGGTDFNQVGNQSTYWNSNGTANVYPSAKC
jgi:subtilase family serine protease